MDVPVLTAVIGVSGTLLGTIVGGCLTTFTNLLLQKRREKAEFRVGCRLIDGELQDNQAAVSTMIERGRFLTPEVISETKGWEEHQHVLASYLSYEAWRDVRWAMWSVRSAHIVAREAKTEETEMLTDTDTKLLAGAMEDIQKGRASLQPYLRKPTNWMTTTINRRLLEPLGIRPRITRPPISG